MSTILLEIVSKKGEVMHQDLFINRPTDKEFQKCIKDYVNNINTQINPKYKVSDINRVRVVKYFDNRDPFIIRDEEVSLEG